MLRGREKWNFWKYSFVVVFRCTPQKVQDLEKKIPKGNWKFYWYNAKHAFCNEARPEVYDANACRTAFDRTFAFFGSKLNYWDLFLLHIRKTVPLLSPFIRSFIWFAKSVIGFLEVKCTKKIILFYFVFWRFCGGCFLFGWSFWFFDWLPRRWDRNLRFLVLLECKVDFEFRLLSWFCCCKFDNWPWEELLCESLSEIFTPWIFSLIVLSSSLRCLSEREIRFWFLNDLETSTNIPTKTNKSNFLETKRQNKQLTLKNLPHHVLVWDSLFVFVADSDVNNSFNRGWDSINFVFNSWGKCFESNSMTKTLQFGFDCSFCHSTSRTSDQTISLLYQIQHSTQIKQLKKKINRIMNILWKNYSTGSHFERSNDTRFNSHCCYCISDLNA